MLEKRVNVISISDAADLMVSSKTLYVEHSGSVVITCLEKNGVVFYLVQASSTLLYIT